MKILHIFILVIIFLFLKYSNAYSQTYKASRKNIPTITNESKVVINIMEKKIYNANIDSLYWYSDLNAIEFNNYLKMQ